jgi:hypothetical protein
MRGNLGEAATVREIRQLIAERARNERELPIYHSGEVDQHGPILIQQLPRLPVYEAKGTGRHPTRALRASQRDRDWR